MEARQLYYFLMACQQSNHLKAAKELAIAPSTLSTSINLLEEELGIQLFRRTQHGFYPTKEARWLYSEAEFVLRTMRAAQSYLGSSNQSSLSEISVTSSLKFFLGRLSRVLSMAIEKVQQSYPDVIFAVKFEHNLEDDLGKIVENGKSSRNTTKITNIHIDYVKIDAFNNYTNQSFVPIYEDSWVVVTNSQVFSSDVKEQKSLSPHDLRRLNLYIPLLPDQLREDAVVYCNNHDLSLPDYIDEDVGSLPRLSQTLENFSFLVPKSALSSRLEQRRLFIYPLQQPLVSHLAAYISNKVPAAHELISEFSDLVSHSDEVNFSRPQLTFKQIGYFLEALDTRNISLAAKKMRIAQPALSSQIRKLETILGRKLFDRQRSGLKPTLAGHAFAVYAGLIHEVLHRVRHNVVSISAKRQSRLRIGVIPFADNNTRFSSALASSLLAWRKQYPEVAIQVLEGPSDILQDWLQTKTVHLIILESNSGFGGRLELSSEEEMGLITNPAHGLVGRDEVTLDDLKDLKFVLPTRIFGIRRLIDSFLSSKTLLKIEIECNSIVTALQLVRQAPLATILPKASVERSISSGELIFTRISKLCLERKLYVGFSNERELSMIEREFIALLYSSLETANPCAN
ncbi:MAG: LysR family transcriptional regulator [Cohaesibacter sp.]|nr:LysR family transcriptional regulator [Cohaesibacter sp.]